MDKCELSNLDVSVKFSLLNCCHVQQFISLEVKLCGKVMNNKYLTCHRWLFERSKFGKKIKFNYDGNNE